MWIESFAPEIPGFSNPRIKLREIKENLEKEEQQAKLLSIFCEIFLFRPLGRNFPSFSLPRLLQTDHKNAKQTEHDTTPSVDGPRIFLFTIAKKAVSNKEQSYEEKEQPDHEAQVQQFFHHGKIFKRE